MKMMSRHYSRQKNTIMSNSNKTTIPGMGNPFESSNQMPVSGPQAGYSGTCFPGMDQRIKTTPNASESHKPVMGFLFSVSRTSSGEYWPLYLGQNTIGRSTNCSIRLSEGTVSDNHAELVIRQMKNPDGVLAFIKDSCSTCGTMLNGSSLGFDPQECKNGDVITIGEHYELYVVLIDVKSLGLTQVEGFVGADAQPTYGNPFAAPAQGGGMMPNMGMPQNPGTAIFGQQPGGFQQPSQPQNSGAAQGTVLMDALKR